MTADTNYYQIALAEYKQAHPYLRRTDELLDDPIVRGKILERAQWLKDNPHRCDCESDHCKAQCNGVGTVRTVYSRICIECAKFMPAKYLL